MARVPKRGAEPEWPAHHQPRSRVGARDWETATGRGPAAAGRAERFQMVSALPRVFARKEHPLALFSMICNGWMSNA